MTEVAPETEVPAQELRIPEETLLQMPLDWHDEFDNNVWRQRSYHNRNHILANEQATEEYFKGMRKYGEDPLRIREGLQAWNRGHPESQISEDELPEVLRWAFRYHDTGNILAGASVINGVLEPHLLEKYTSWDAEERSEKIAEEAIRNSDMEEEKKRRFIPLIKYLVGKTTFGGDLEEPFARFMKVMDQIGNGFYNNQPDYVEGLILETLGETPDFYMNPHQYYNFVHVSLDRLLGDEVTLESLLKVWEKPLPPVKRDMPDEPIPAKEFMKGR